ncbi:MAG: type II secretion system protein [Chthonomonadales bacterium]|nr:type II secretion system protein [Chthonomonadales bacterium]
MRPSEIARARRGAFTLVELLVVMAISVILLGLIFGPMVESFNLTNRARVQVLAQDVSRQIMEQLQREIADGVFVFDNASLPITFWVPDPTGRPLAMPVPYAMLDLVPPARVNDQNPNLGSGVPLDPTTGLPVESARGPLALPVAPGRAIVRIWTGLRDNATVPDDSGAGLSGRPARLYANFYDNRRNTTFDQHNPFLLYRALFTPYTVHGQVDTRLMNIGRFGSLQAAMRDPNFFYDNDEAIRPNDASIATNAVPGWKDLNKDGKVNYSENWQAIGRSLVPSDRADMVSVERDRDGRPLYGNDPVSGLVEMRIAPQARFQPTYVGNDAGAPASTADTANEAPAVRPTSYVEAYGHWTTPFRLYVYRSSLNDPLLRYFYWTGAGPVRYVEYDTATGSITNGGGQGENTYFYPLEPTNLPNAMPAGRFLMFTVDPRRGIVNFAFPHTITQRGAARPIVLDPQKANDEYDYVKGLPGYGLSSYRYVSLLPQNASTNPNGVSLGLNPNGATPLARIPNSTIVPGSEVVTGPDMRPGPRYGQPVAYRRAPRGTDPRTLGANEYTINYADVPNANLNPSDPDPRAAAMMTAVQRAGTIIFDSQEDASGAPHHLPVAQGPDGAPVRISVTYQIQDNLAGDVVKTDYLTRQLMTFGLSVRLYDFNSGQPQQVTLTQKIRVRNLQR